MTERVNVFELLKEKEVEFKDLLAVQDLTGGRWDITFKSEVLQRTYWPSLSKEDRRCTAHQYGGRDKILTVLHAPIELEDNCVRYILGRYGKVIAGRFLTHRDYPTIF